MLKIVGLGCAYPDTVISNADLLQLAGDIDIAKLEQSSGIQRRCSTLPFDYLEQTGNSSVELVPTRASESPTSLGLRAAQTAILQAGIDSSQVGLIVADCLTPWETIPAEATRIGKALSIKVPAYDILGTGSALFFIDLFGKWKVERLPDYTLVVVVSTPTQRINYRHGVEGFYFGDCAVAFVLSTEEKKGLRIVDAKYRPGNQGSLSLDLYGHLQFNLPVARELVKQTMTAPLTQASQKEWFTTGFGYLIGPQFELPLFAQLCERCSITADRCWQQLEQFGCCLAASGMATLATNYDNLQIGDAVLMIEAGPGAGAGYGLFVLE